MSSPTITTTALPNATVGTAYSATLQGSGGVLPYRWAINAGSLPLGLSLNSTTGVVSGTPETAGTSSALFELNDAAENSSGAELSIEVDASGGSTTASGPTPTAGGFRPTYNPVAQPQSSRPQPPSPIKDWRQNVWKGK